MDSAHPLDNIIWKALTTRQAEFAESFNQARRFRPEVSPLGGLREPTPEGYQSLGALVGAAETIGLFLEEPYRPQLAWNLIAGAPMPEMVYEEASGPPSRSSSAPEVIELGAADVPDMTGLTALTKPGPFNKRTHELGTYLGIRRDGKLIAMAGERLKVPGYTEVSAVCTHPDHTGHGYARILLMEIVRRICSRGEIAFLHVRQDNVRAVQLYRKLGFSQRVLLHFAVLRKANS
jgi:ribosomal protein S18 acetylase RimI-like enzyme